VNTALAVYADAMAAYGFENTGMLRDADELDLADCFVVLDMKKPHQTAVRRAVAALRPAGGRGGAAGAGAASAVIIDTEAGVRALGKQSDQEGADAAFRCALAIDPTNLNAQANLRKAAAHREFEEEVKEATAQQATMELLLEEEEEEKEGGGSGTGGGGGGGSGKKRGGRAKKGKKKRK
jgi:hypothetical protein